MALIIFLISVASIAHLDSSVEMFDFWTILSDANYSNIQSLKIVPESADASSQPNTAGNLQNNDSNKSKMSALATHALCADILSGYVDEKGLVDYKTLRRKRLALISVLAEFADLDPNSYASWTESDKLAFWINAHNMCMIRAVIDNYPIQASRFKAIFYPPNSVMQISNFWDKADNKIMGENYTLNEIENKIIRGHFSEPRICFAISYASMGSAPLRREPYYGHNLAEQLDDQARIFLASDSGMKIDRNESVVYLSAIFEWYGKDFSVKYVPADQFGDKSLPEAAELTYISKVIPQKDTDWLVRKNFEVKYVRYDWSLNEQP